VIPDDRTRIEIWAQTGGGSCLLSHRNIEEAAKAAGIGYKTLLRWLELPEFQAAYRKARREAVQQAIARLQQATGIASLTILKLMTDANVPRASNRWKCGDSGWSCRSAAIAPQG
jgi:hypothetical protein